MITGASSGLGEALAHTFYRCGCRIILVARREEELERVKNDLINTHQVRSTIFILAGKYIEYQSFLDLFRQFQSPIHPLFCR